MTRDAFVNLVVNECTENGAIPAAPKLPRINSIIDLAARFFWENSDEAVSTEYIIIPSKITETPLFKAKRMVQFPKCVEAIMGLQETGAIMNTGSMNVNPDYRKTNFNYYLAVGGDSDTMLYGVMASYYSDFIRNFVVRTITFDFNPHTHMLTVLGRDAFVDMVAVAAVHIPLDGLMDYELFLRYVIGKCKVSFASTFGFVEAKLIGGLKIDLASIKEDGKEMIAEVKTRIEEDRQTLDFFSEF